ncbi:DUF6296 family protein [Kitasatospora sp. NPDC127111]|uniref:DUF6296 family protein n=1 Tax=Kitasatospora sp. NPDC127111 TaxID=3345363 RepID=UPI00363564CC
MPAPTTKAPADGYLVSVRTAHSETPLRILVTPTSAKGPAGHPVFHDTDGRLLVEIAPDGTCRHLLRRGLYPAALHALAPDHEMSCP